MPDLRIDDLDRFDQGLPPVPHLPPTDVRRRGDRMRRRNAGLTVGAGVLAAALAVGVPMAALQGGNGERGIEPAPQPTQAPSEPPGGWVTTIPDDFPLTAGFADEAAEPLQDGLAEDPSLTGVCRTEGFAGYVDDVVVTYRGESENGANRILAVYPDAATAAAELAELRDIVEGCPPRSIAEGTTMVVDAVPVDLGAEESFAFSQQIRNDDDDSLSELSLFQLARTGNAIYVDSSYGAAGGDEVVAFESARLEERSAEPLARMCVFAAEPCEG